MKTIESTLIFTVLFICFLLAMANCTGPNQPLPKTPTALHLDPAGRAVFRDGFRAGRSDEQEHLSANHKRHQYPSAFEEAFRCGYITGLTYNWFVFGKEDRIRREYPGYLDAYSKQLVHWTRTTATPEAN